MKPLIGFIWDSVTERMNALRDVKVHGKCMESVMGRLARAMQALKCTGKGGGAPTEHVWRSMGGLRCQARGATDMQGGL